jgi:hypothetical protein
MVPAGNRRTAAVVDVGSVRAHAIAGLTCHHAWCEVRIARSQGLSNILLANSNWDASAAVASRGQQVHSSNNYKVPYCPHRITRCIKVSRAVSQTQLSYRFRLLTQQVEQAPEQADVCC